MIANAITSAKNVPLGTRKFDASGCCPSMPESLLGGEREDEQRHEGEVDEVHRLDQADRQEEDAEQAALGLGLTGYAGDRRAAGEAVADGRADGAATEGETATDERTGELNRLGSRVS